MISLSAPTYDPGGVVRIPARASNPFFGQRRMTVTATLDGGVSVYDGGYSIADQTLNVTLRRPKKEMMVTLQYLAAYYSQLTLCCESGAFSAALAFSLSGDSLTLSLRLTGRLDT